MFIVPSQIYDIVYIFTLCPFNEGYGGKILTEKNDTLTFRIEAARPPP